MRTSWLVFILFIGLVSCDKKDVYKGTDEAPSDINEMLPMEAKHIEVPEGKIALVFFYEDTLAIMTRTAEVMVPKVNTLVKSFDNAIRIEYLEENNNNVLATNKYQVFQVVAFEDSENGDYDYNDLVFHAKIYQTSQVTKLYIHPVALGSIKPIKLGVKIEGYEEIILAENCRTDLFEGKPGFINTTTDGSGTNFKYENTKNFTKNIPCNFGKDINWFIEVENGKRLYAVSKNYPSLNGENMAYGLILMNINAPFTYKGHSCGLDWFNYPQERVDIKSVYPNFDEYLTGNLPFSKIFSTSLEGFYPAIVVNEKRQAQEDCLYAITFPN